MFLHYIQYLFLHSYLIVKIHPFLHHTQRKSTCFYTIARPIFYKSYSIIHGGFFGLPGLGEECQGLGLGYLLKESRCLLFKRQNDRTMRRVFAWFSTFCMSLTYLCPILAQTIRLRKDNSKIINSSFFPAGLRLCATARSVNIRYLFQIKSYLRFRVCSVRHIGCFYTVAKNFYTISRIRLCLLESQTTEFVICISIYSDSTPSHFEQIYEGP